MAGNWKMNPSTSAEAIALADALEAVDGREVVVFPPTCYLDAVATLNGVTTSPCVKRFEQLKKKDLAEFDLLVAADVCFWDELVKPVSKLIDRALSAGVSQIIIADPERPTFHEMAEKTIARHGGELVHWRTSGKAKATGALLVINNQ